MNSKRSKEIKNKANELFIDWLKSLLNKEEAAKISMDNYFQFLPKQTHLMTNNQMWLTAYSPRWIANKIKNVIRKNPQLNISSLTLEDIKKEEKQWKQKERNFQN
tara:strand:+ start:232 stop:546 length:315 start_codon:yes stop_codon:yes gene_type:complete